MNKYLLVILIALIPMGQVSARKEYKQLRSYIKNSTNLDQGMQIVQKLEKDSSAMNDPELYSLAAQIQIKKNDIENQKVYLKQQADTASLFSTTLNIFKYYMLMDEKEGIPDKKGRVNHENRGKIRTILRRYYPNLYNAGLFYIKKKNYPEADKYFSMYIDAAASPIFEKDNLREKDPKMPRAAFWSMTSNYEQKNYKGVFRYDSLAIRDSANIDVCLQYKSMSYQALKNEKGMVRELMNGIRIVPQNLFFFSHLTDYYNKKKDYKTALALCDSLIKTDTAQLMYRFGRSVELFHLKRYEECAKLSREIIARDSSNADAYYYLASCYYNPATETDVTAKPDINSSAYKKQKARAKELFKTALPYMEQYRKLRPNDSARWAQPLYRIYLTLNMGKQFDEMDKLLRESDAKAKAEQEKAKAEAEAKQKAAGGAKGK